MMGFPYLLGEAAASMCIATGCCCCSQACGLDSLNTLSLLVKSERGKTPRVTGVSR